MKGQDRRESGKIKGKVTPNALHSPPLSLAQSTLESPERKSPRRLQKVLYSSVGAGAGAALSAHCYRGQNT